MYLLQEELARSHRQARTWEAQRQRRGRHAARARRLARKADRAVAQARLAVARVI